MSSWYYFHLLSKIFPSNNCADKTQEGRFENATKKLARNSRLSGKKVQFLAAAWRLSEEDEGRPHSSWREGQQRRLFGIPRNKEVSGSASLFHHPCLSGLFKSAQYACSLRARTVRANSQPSMHASSLWWKLLWGSKHKAPTSQAKAKARTRQGTKKKSRKQADRRATAPSAKSAPGSGGQQEHVTRELPDTAVRNAGGDGVVRTLLNAVGIRRLKAMTSRSRVCGNSKYKVNNQNLEKFEELLSKIPEGEKLKGTTSLASLPERHEDATRAPTPSAAPTVPSPPATPGPPEPPAPPALPERAFPDISPSATMGSSVTTEYELFCKAFHSEAKELLAEEEQEQVPSNPMRQMLQQASVAATRGPQLQRVTSAFGAADSPRDTRTIDETYAPTAVAPGVLVLMAAS